MFSLRASRLLILQLRPAAFTTTKPIRGNTISSTLLKQVFFERLQRITLKEVNLVTGSIGSIATGLAVWTARKEYKRWFGTGLQDDLKKKILKSTYVINKKPSLYISRGGLPDIMNIFASKEKHKTVMVCGPRGSGKTAAVRETLKGQKRVVVVTLAGESQQLARAITESLGLNTNEQVNHTEVVVNALKEIRRNPGSLEHPPVLVVEVNERFTSSKAFEDLALMLKHWGYEEALVCPIVVLSTSRAAMGLDIGMDELRAEFASVDDLDHEKAKQYIEKLCTELKLEGANDNKAVSKYAEQVVQILGSRLLHLDSFADKVRSENTRDQQQVSLKDLVPLASEPEAKMLKGSRRALKKFHKRFPNANKKDLYRLFKKPGVTVDVDEFSEMVGEDVATALDGLSDIQPHPFYVDPKTETVRVGSVFFQKVIDTDRASRWWWFW
ncbi:hypothetical protein GBAR_LOCUS2811 [Geodia barretti]|uniref:ORC1/DEAH AAA+ ATPase domain-containing protein n=1 Tax=Geodia barretti TaxID=519541 RepID=A0AA35R2L9_GEOBA|nr:hypothetical protein GBAR_LOCUS2811 [Geodia barretti]